MILTKKLIYITNTISYIAKKRELRDAAPERCCLTLIDPAAHRPAPGPQARGRGAITP